MPDLLVWPLPMRWLNVKNSDLLHGGPGFGLWALFLPTNNLFFLFFPKYHLPKFPHTAGMTCVKTNFCPWFQDESPCMKDEDIFMKEVPLTIRKMKSLIITYSSWYIKKRLYIIMGHPLMSTPPGAHQGPFQSWRRWGIEKFDLRYTKYQSH